MVTYKPSDEVVRQAYEGKPGPKTIKFSFEIEINYDAGLEAVKKIAAIFKELNLLREPS